MGVLPMRWDLRIDLAVGLFLAASPWLFGFARGVWVPHVAFGAFAVAAGLLTRTVPKYAPAPPEPYKRAGRRTQREQEPRSARRVKQSQRRRQQHS